MRRRFETTRWSVVLEAQDADSALAGAALSTFCRAYWEPLYAFVRSRGYHPEECADLVQGYFLRLLEKDVLGTLAPSRGRLRSFLLASMRNFLANERERRETLRRGGGAAIVSFDLEAAEGRLQAASPEPSPEAAFERRWALALLERALDRLRRESEARGGAERFDRLQGYLTGERPAPSYLEVAGDLGVSEGAVKLAVHRMRRRFRSLLRDEVAATVADPREVEDELRHLLHALEVPYR